MMDLKGGSWVGGMYQKFEAMCAEVEEAMYEDTFKYVENHVRTVGESVKKFYSEVMEDLHHPSPLDSVKTKSPLLNVVHLGDEISRSRAVDEKTRPADVASELVKDFDGDNDDCDGTIDYESSCSAIYTVIKPCEPTFIDSVGENCTEVNSKNRDAELASTCQSNSVAEDLDCKKDIQNKCLCNLPTINAISTNKFDDVVTSISPHDETDESSSIQRDVITTEAYEVSCKEEAVVISRVMTESYGDDVVKEKQARSHSETPSAFMACKFSICDPDKQPVLVGQQLNEVKLEESCVLVEKNVNPKLTLGHAQKSYKKKIQDVFSPRRWSKSKRDQEQHAAWYEEQSVMNLVSTSMVQSEIQKKSQTCESFESDWELL